MLSAFDSAGLKVCGRPRMSQRTSPCHAGCAASARPVPDSDGPAGRVPSVLKEASPQVNPLPNPSSKIRCPGRILPEAIASDRAIGIEAADVLPTLLMFFRTLSVGTPRARSRVVRRCRFAW